MPDIDLKVMRHMRPTSVGKADVFGNSAIEDVEYTTLCVSLDGKTCEVQWAGPADAKSIAFGLRKLANHLAPADH